jgi:hypothetical protein
MGTVSGVSARKIDARLALVKSIARLTVLLMRLFGPPSLAVRSLARISLEQQIRLHQDQKPGQITANVCGKNYKWLQFLPQNRAIESANFSCLFALFSGIVSFDEKNVTRAARHLSVCIISTIAWLFSSSCYRFRRVTVLVSCLL